AAICTASSAESSRESAPGAPGLTMLTCAMAGANGAASRAASRRGGRTRKARAWGEAVGAIRDRVIDGFLWPVGRRRTTRRGPGESSRPDGGGFGRRSPARFRHHAYAYPEAPPFRRPGAGAFPVRFPDDESHLAAVRRPA